MSSDTMTVHGIDLEVTRLGAGPPLLLLHGFQPIAPDARFVDLLSRRATVIAPSHPR